MINPPGLLLFFFYFYYFPLGHRGASDIILFFDDDGTTRDDNDDHQIDANTQLTRTTGTRPTAHVTRIFTFIFWQRRRYYRDGHMPEGAAKNENEN